jgi:hypothetical protein
MSQSSVSLAPYQSVLVKAWNGLARWAPGHLMSPALSLDAVMKSAISNAGFDDFGSTGFREPLAILLESLAETGDLTPFGRFYTKAMVTELLANRLKLVDLWGRQPEILSETVRKPVIILGLPRTGTSFLFNLLSQDPAHRVLSNWETTVAQVPPEGTYTWKNDPRRKKGRFLMGFQNYLVPQMKAMHRFYLDGPEECTPLLMQEFTTQALAGMFNVPAYSRWLDTASHSATCQHHKQILQTLQWKYPGERWLLKSPDHIAAIEAMLETYPDACVIHMHRDPVKSVASWASLNAAFRGIYMRSINAGELGQQVLNRLATDVTSYLTQRRRCMPERFLDMQYRDLTSDPLGVVQGIYERFDLVLSADAEKRLQVFLAKDRQKKRAHHYSPGDFGLGPQLIQEDFQEYLDVFSIESEG